VVLKVHLENHQKSLKMFCVLAKIQIQDKFKVLPLHKVAQSRSWTFNCTIYICEACDSAQLLVHSVLYGMVLNPSFFSL
jgi:hypothetical protein